MSKKLTAASVLNWNHDELEAWILSDPATLVGQFRTSNESKENVTLPLVLLANRGLSIALDAVLRSEPQTNLLRDLSVQMLKLLSSLDLDPSKRSGLVNQAIALLNSNRAANHKLALRILPLLGREASASIPSLKKHSKKTSIGELVQACIEKVRSASAPTPNPSSLASKSETDTVEFSQSGNETGLSSESAKFVDAASRSMKRIPEKISSEVSKLHKRLGEIEGMTFSNDQQGRDEAFQVVKHINAWAHSLSRVLFTSDSPVYLTRRPIASNASTTSVCIQTFDYVTGKLLNEGTSIPLLTSQPDSELPFSSKAKESLNRYEALEQLTTELALLSGYRSIDRPDALRVKDLVNGLRRATGVSLIYSCLLYTSPSPRDQRGSRMPSSA